MAIWERSTPSSKSTPRASIADKPISEACFNDWKRFCFVLREIASGNSGHPMSGVDAQGRAQAALTECGYTWPGRVQSRRRRSSSALAGGSSNQGRDFAAKHFDILHMLVRRILGDVETE